MNKNEENSIVPELRFPEFIENWEIKSLSDICDVYRGGTFSKADMDKNGSHPCIHYGELFTKYNELINQVYSRTNKSVGFKSEIGDILMPSSDVTPDGLAKASAIMLEGVVLGGDMNILRPKMSFNSIFLSYLLNYSKNEITKLVSGTTVKHIYPSQIITCKLPVVNNKLEQQKIADCLSSLDELITAQNNKIELLKSHKKGLMQNIFPAEAETKPKLRFREFENEWTEKSFEELFEIGNGRDYKHLEKGNIPVYGSGGYMLSVNEYLYEGESACIGRKGTIDKPMLLTGKFWTVDTLFYTHSFKNCIPKYIYYVFQTINWLKHNEAGGVPSLSKSNIYKIKIKISSLTEQQKIVDILTAIDKTIEIELIRLEELKNHKKGLMQKLFPKVN